MKQNRVFINAITLPDAWFQAVYNILEHGRPFKIDQGSFAGSTRLEFDWVDIQIEKPFLRDVDGLPLIPEMPEGSNIPPPVTKEYLVGYSQYIMGSKTGKGESYTYGQRMNKAPIENYPIGKLRKSEAWKDILIQDDKVYENRNIIIWHYNTWDLSQVELLIWTYKNKGHRNNQMILQVGQPTDMLLKDPPCLRHIDTRIQDNKLHFYIYFRSWDLWSGFPANLAGISILQEYIASEIGVEKGEFICTSKGLHLYSYATDFAKLRCMK